MDIFNKKKILKLEEEITELKQKVINQEEQIKKLKESNKNILRKLKKIRNRVKEAEKNKIIEIFDDEETETITIKSLKHTKYEKIIIEVLKDYLFGDCDFE